MVSGAASERAAIVRRSTILFQEERTTGNRALIRPRPTLLAARLARLPCSSNKKKLQILSVSSGFCFAF